MESVPGCWVSIIDPEVTRQALARNFVDDASTDPTEFLAKADLVLIAVPVRTSLDLIRRLPGLHPGSAVVMDVGSTKSEVVKAMALLPERFDPIGGHPMCGKEFGTLVNAEAGLFQRAAFALVPLPHTTSTLVQLPSSWSLSSMGNRCGWMLANTTAG